MQESNLKSNAYRWDYSLYSAPALNVHQENLQTINSISNRYEVLSYCSSSKLFTKRAGETESWSGYITQQITQINDPGACAKCVAEGIASLFKGIEKDFLELISLVSTHNKSKSSLYMSSKKIYALIFKDLQLIVNDASDRALIYVSTHYQDKLKAQNNSYYWMRNSKKIAEYELIIDSIKETRAFIKKSLLININRIVEEYTKSE